MRGRHGQAREQLDVVTVVCANSAYNILKLEMALQSVKLSSPPTSSTIDDHHTSSTQSSGHFNPTSASSAAASSHSSHNHTSRPRLSTLAPPKRFTTAFASLTDLTSPRVSWVDLAAGFGVPSVRVDTVEALIEEFGQALRREGPSLIEAVLP
eukprot:516277-Pyramimonas_sp.AAC.1